MNSSQVNVMQENVVSAHLLMNKLFILINYIERGAYYDRKKELQEKGE